MESSFSIDAKKDKKQTALIISGELIINYIEKIKDSILKEVDFSNNLHIHVSNPSGMDITFIQLISSLQKTCQSKQVEFTLDCTLNEEIYTLASNAGFNNLFKL